MLSRLGSHLLVDNFFHTLDDFLTLTKSPNYGRLIQTNFLLDPWSCWHAPSDAAAKKMMTTNERKKSPPIQNSRTQHEHHPIQWLCQYQGPV